MVNLSISYLMINCDKINDTDNEWNKTLSDSIATLFFMEYYIFITFLKYIKLLKFTKKINLWFSFW